MNDHETRKYLSAFADGELDVEQNLRVLEHMAMHPEATRRVMHQQQLRQLVSKSVQSQTPATPPSLRQAIEQATIDEPAEPRAGVIGQITHWLPTALAAGLLLAAIAVRQNPAPPMPTSPSTVASTDADSIALAADTVARFERRHVRCTRLIDSLVDAQAFPVEISALPEALKQSFNTGDLPRLDLSSLGYRYKATGRCRIPGQRSVHLVYESSSTAGPRDALSLWIAAWEGSPGIEPDRLYQAGDPALPHPIVFWRHGPLIYYLVGDDDATVAQAADYLIRHDHRG